MNIIFRVDSSTQMGTGHVMRCLTLADALKKEGAAIEFISRAHEGHLIEHIERQGFKTHKLSNLCGVEVKVDEEKLYGKHWLGSSQQKDAILCKPMFDTIKPDWLIVDQYGIDETWQRSLKDCYGKLMVIDDLANRVHECDLLLDQTYGRKVEDYTGLVPQNSQLLLGAEFALLRPEFAEWRDYSLRRRVKPEFKTLLITMGGADPDNVTGDLLEALKGCSLPKEFEIIIVMGATAPHLKRVKRQAEMMLHKTTVRTNVNNMAEIMANADLAIAAAGTTTWERCSLGLPSLVVVLAENQKEIARLLSKQSITLTIDRKRLFEGVKMIGTMQGVTLLSLSRNAERIVDARGVERVVKVMQGCN